MKRPETVQVGAFTYRLEYLPGLPADGESWGSWQSAQGCIQIRCDVPPQRVAATFIHEVTHAALDALGYCNKLDLEAVAVFSGLFWPMFWRDNPEAFAWWIGLTTGGQP